MAGWLLVLFDLDGTLLDYHSAARRAFTQAFEAFGIPCQPHYHEHFEAINLELWRLYEEGGISPQDLRVVRYQRLRDDLNLPLEPAAFSRRYLDLLSRGSDLLPGAMETVQALHGLVPLGVITNGFTDVQRNRLAQSGLAPYFDHMACSECAGAAKPQPAIFDLAMQQHGLSDPTRVVIVGDNYLTDIGGGHAYGMATCWYNPTHREREDGPAPRWETDDMTSLPGLLGLAR